MFEFDKKEQQRISSLQQMDRYLIDPRDHVLRSFDGRPVMKESTIPVIIAIMLAGCAACAVLGLLRQSTQRILLLAAAAFCGFYAVRYYQYLRALKGK